MSGNNEIINLTIEALRHSTYKRRSQDESQGKYPCSAEFFDHNLQTATYNAKKAKPLSLSSH